MVAAMPTRQEPLRSFMAEVRAREAGAVLSISVVHGFPRGDVPDMGAKVLVVTNDDGLSWTFFLHPGHRFDDGSEVTAEAVKFSFERTLTLKAPPSQFLFFLRGVEAVAPYEVRFTLRTPVPFFLEVLAVPTASIINPKVMAQAKGADLELIRK
jgi:ABC-type transport system substrate-binding protein